MAWRVQETIKVYNGVAVKSRDFESKPAAMLFHTKEANRIVKSSSMAYDNIYGPVTNFKALEGSIKLETVWVPSKK